MNIHCDFLNYWFGKQTNTIFVDILLKDKHSRIYVHTYEKKKKQFANVLRSTSNF